MEHPASSDKNLSIRRATPDDAARLSNVIMTASESVKGDDFNDQGWALLERTNTPEAFKSRFGNPDYFALVYEQGHTILGYLAMVDYEKIDHMFVLPGFRNKGISKNLWSAAKSICAAHGNTGFYWVRSSSYAQEVYESFGFRATQARQTMNGISFVFMELREDATSNQSQRFET